MGSKNLNSAMVMGGCLFIGEMLKMFSTFVPNGQEMKNSTQHF